MATKGPSRSDFIKTTYDISLDSQSSVLLPLGFSPFHILLENPKQKTRLMMTQGSREDPPAHYGSSLWRVPAGGSVVSSHLAGPQAVARVHGSGSRIYLTVKIRPVDPDPPEQQRGGESVIPKEAVQEGPQYLSLFHPRVLGTLWTLPLA